MMQKVIDIFNRLPLSAPQDPSTAEAASERPSANDRASPVPSSEPTTPNNATTNASPENGPPPPEPLPAADWTHRAMLRLWQRLTQIYGHRWTSQFGDATDAEGRLTGTARCWADGLGDLSPAALKRGLHRCVHERADPWPPTLPEFRQLCQPAPEELGLPTVEEAYRVACLQKPDWPGVHPIVWHARQAVGVFELISEPSSRTRPRFEAAYQALARRALAGERFAFPADLTAPALPNQSQPLTEEERAEAQRWALELSRLDDSEARQQALARAPAPWQPIIRHYLAWRLGMGALRAILRESEPATEVK